MLMTLAGTKFVFLLSLPCYFGCYGNLKFPLTYKAKSGKLQFFENYCSLRPEKWQMQTANGVDEGM